MLSKSLCFFQSYGILVIKPHWRSKSDSLGVPVPLQDPQAGKPDTKLRIFTTVGELLWYYCSPVCGSPDTGFDFITFASLQTRQHIKKQRQYFVNKGLSSQGYGFYSGHVWMWESDYKQSWAPKNWCFWTVVLEKTLESPLACKEIQPVHPKGDQSWVFIGRTDVEAETPILWPPGSKNWLIWKDPDAEKDWRQEKKGTTEDEMIGWHHWLNGHEFE